MSLVHPIVAPQIALRATRGRFLGTEANECVALLFSDRIALYLLEDMGSIEDDSLIVRPPHLELTIPQPPMTMGDPEREILPNIGGLFFTVGRNRDMLAMQYDNLLTIVSVNHVDQLLQLQGVWGLPKQKDHNISPRHTLAKAASAANLSTMVENTSLASQPSGLSLQSSLPPPKPSPDGSQIFLVSRHKSGDLMLIVLDCFGKESIKHDVDYLNVLTLGWLSDDVIYFVYLNRKFHKKFQTLRLGSKLKQSGFLGIGGRKMTKNAFLPECHVTIAADFVSAVPDLKGCQNLVFKDYVFLGTRDGGYIRVNYKGTGTWEVVQNAKNAIGCMQLDDSALLIHRVVKNPPANRAGLAPPSSPDVGSTSVTPTSANQFCYSLVRDGTVHAIRGDPQVGACLSSKHNINGDYRFQIKLLSLGKGLMLDYKRYPMRVYKLTYQPTIRINVLPSKEDVAFLPLVSSKEAADFLVKTATAIYTRDINGDDNYISKIISGEHMRIPLNRPGLVKIMRRDAKSLWAIFSHSAIGTATPSGAHVVPAGAATSYPPEIRILEESSKTVTKLRVKAQFQFGTTKDMFKTQANNNFSHWYFNRLIPVHKNVIIVGLSSNRFSTKPTWEEDVKQFDRYSDMFADKNSDWALFLVSFVGSTSKSNPVPPKAQLILRGATPDIAPQPLPCPGTPNQYYLQVFNAQAGSITSVKKVTVNNSGEFKFTSETSKVFPYALSQSLSSTFFTDINQTLDGIFLIGKISSNEEGTVHYVKNILNVDALDASSGSSLVIDGKSFDQTKIWSFDSNGAQFREFGFKEVPENRKAMLYRQEQLITNLCNTSSSLKNFKVHPLFRAQYFTETYSAKRFRPLPELKALVCAGLGFGVDAEAYIKTPDNGYFAMFRIQNRKLIDTLSRLRNTILSKRVGSWIPDEVKDAWLESQQQTNMISGTVFSAYWRLEPEMQLELCEEAGVPSDLLEKVRPP